MRKLHPSGLFYTSYNHFGKNLECVGIYLQKYPKGVERYSIEIDEKFIDFPLYDVYTFCNGNKLYVRLKNGYTRVFVAVKDSSGLLEMREDTLCEELLDDEDVLLYHLGLYGKKFDKK